MYTIVASICQHPLRTSRHLPWSGSTLDFDVRYCPSCENSRSIRSERKDAEREYQRSHLLRETGAISKSTHRSTRRRYDDSRRADTNDQDYWQDRDDRERREQGRPTLREEGRRFAGLDDPEWLSFKREVSGYGRSTRFEESSSPHRRESRYREQPSYRRSSRSYSPGKYSDRSGRGYYDTSNTPSASRRCQDEDDDEDLDRLNDVDLRARQRALRRALSKYR